jgi:lysophospholipase L1-like esterase
MNVNDFFPENEQPLDRLVEDGGFCSIFRTFACVGDSLSSGEFQLPLEDGKWGYYDMFDYSWGQFMARTLGSKVYNFSKGGMTAKWYVETFGDEKGYWNPELKCQAYFMALGVNDIFNQKHEVGDFGDICYEDYNKNADTFIGNYAYIIQRYKQIQPEAKFFLVGVPDSGRNTEAMEAHEYAVRGLSERFDRTYYLDLKKYCIPYVGDFRSKFFLNGHMTPTGYIFSAKIIGSYIDYIIRHNMEDFKDVGLMGYDYDRSSLN